MQYSIRIKNVEFNIQGLGSSKNYFESSFMLMRIEDFLESATFLKEPRQKSLAFLKDIITTQPICPPLLSFFIRNSKRVIKHEGRHRAILCKNIGLTHIPVAFHGCDPHSLAEGYLSQNNKFLKPQLRHLEDNFS